MGKVYPNKTCQFCGKTGKVIETWGKIYCKECYDKKPKKGNGHSGMVKGDAKQLTGQASLTSGLFLQRIPKGDKLFATLYLEHYPASKGIVGRQLNYIIRNKSKIVGIIGANSPPLNYKKFREYFKTDNEKLFLNNNVFRIIVSDKNQATQVLRLFRETIQKDYPEQYGEQLLGLITFVEPPRTGNIYKADNWDYLGLTQGISVKRRGSMDKWLNKEYSKGTQKHIFAIRFKRIKLIPTKPEEESKPITQM